MNTKEFQPISKEKWIEKATKDLKGKTLESLQWIENGLPPIPPMFHPEDEVISMRIPPRSYQGEGGSWQIRQSYGPTDGNAEILKGLQQGVEGIHLEGIEDESVSVLLKGVYLNMASVTLPSTKSLNQQLSAVAAMVEDSKEVKGNILFDPITSHLDSGSPIKKDELDNGVQNHTTQVQEHCPSFRAITVNAAQLFEAGATDAQELAYALLSGKAYLESMIASGMTIDDAASKIEFNLAAGNSYFLTIAKFRAMRIMWSKIVSAFNPNEACSVVTWINAVTSMRNFDFRDFHNNLLRTTTSAMSAIIGGADSLEVTNIEPWTESADQLRWARNIQHLLKEESWLDAQIDEGEGSYYIEYLTSVLHKESVGLFERWNEHGGLFTDEGVNDLLSSLTASKALLIDSIKNETRVVVGVNRFVNEGPTKPSFETEFKGNLESLIVSLNVES